MYEFILAHKKALCFNNLYLSAWLFFSPLCVAEWGGGGGGFVSWHWGENRAAGGLEVTEHLWNRCGTFTRTDRTTGGCSMCMEMDIQPWPVRSFALSHGSLCMILTLVLQNGEQQKSERWSGNNCHIFLTFCIKIFTGHHSCCDWSWSLCEYLWT